MEPKFPLNLPEFAPEKQIGSGGFGEVWLARQLNLDRDVAIKVGHVPLHDSAAKRRFERECKALGRLSDHSGIVDVYLSGISDNGLPYLVMEYVEGGSLADRLGKLDEPTLRKLGVQLCSALSAAHKLGILHRDLKPGNVFIRSNGDAVVGDFGIARLGDGDNTTTNQIVASVAYVAPEILDGAAPSPAADIYGIGVTLATALLGRSPFSSSESYTASSVIQRVISGHHEPLMTQGVSPSFSSVLEHTLSVDPTRRPSSADELQQLLISDLSTPPPLSQPLSPTQPLPSTTDATVQNLAPSSGSQQTSPVKASSNTTLVGILMVGTLLVVTAGLGLFLALGGEEAQSTSISSTTETGSINSTTVPNTTSADVLSPSTTPSDVASTTTSVTTNAEEPTTVKQPADPTDNQRIDATQVTANVEVRVFERVRFAQGTSSASVEGAVIRAERDVYILEAQAGQTMLIELASTADNASFTLVAPDNTIATTEAVQEQITLPLNGDYKVVIAPSPGNAEYNVSFTIE